MEVFQTVVEEEKWLNFKPFVVMETQLSRASTKMDGEIDPDDTYMILIPGYEGHKQIFESVCKRLKIQAITAQLGPGVKMEGIHDIAQNIYAGINELLEAQPKFYILGYSFGVTVAIELASMLEEDGRQGIVFCIDNSPDTLKGQLEDCFGYSEEIIQDKIIKHVYCQLSDESQTTELDKALTQSEDWVTKVEAFIKITKEKVSYSHGYLKDVLNSLYHRIVLAKEYEPTYKLKSEIVLVKGKPERVSISRDCSLSRYSFQPIRVFDVDADHTSVPEDCKLPTIINKMLDLKLLEEFKRKNLCTAY